MRDVGSSPLARGLQAAHTVVGWANRDHPRSRGVYVGLGDDRRHRRMDHPRSRGVYSGSSGVKLSSWGSSPLARGLRAGPGRHAVAVPDHPRSRGVYGHGAAWLEPAAGIIPARAGFTADCRSTSCRPPDHPRSRGVYPPSLTAWTDPKGSSPLARGLPRVRVAAALGGRIIPARAGFTSHPGKHVRRYSDHPRSRGVYTVENAGEFATSGSSPLARGLLADRGYRRLDSGIIPARAGFTSSTRTG